MLVVVALGGNALLRRDEAMSAAVQRSNVKEAAAAIAAIAAEHRVVVSHGNGPQVGLLALQNEAYGDTEGYPLDVLDAESEGMVGYLIEQELGRHLPQERLATLLTQVVVDPADPAFANPTKFIGPGYEARDARFLAHDRGWAIAQDGEVWRRVVPSPEPKTVVELHTIRILVHHGITVTCAGGGGIPVVVDDRNGLRGVEAVIDKDLSAALLAHQLGAGALLLLTDVDAVFEGWGTDGARAIGVTSPAALQALDLPAGSMGPKVEAACRFVEGGGRMAGIGGLADAAAILRGEAGTVVCHGA